MKEFRTFIKLRALMANNKNLSEKIEILEKKYDKEYYILTLAPAMTFLFEIYIMEDTIDKS